jgi:hypothetical protein
MIFPDFRVNAAAEQIQQWLFGQKIEYTQEWRHNGFTLGELVSSMSLLPNEELTIEVSSWQRTKSEISQETDDTRRTLLEQENKQTDEQNTINEAATNSGWNVSATGSVSFGPASASMSASYSENTSQRSEQTERSMRESTAKAANEVSSRRAMKITQTTEAGSEQTTTRRIKNPNTCHTLTFNFFQIVKIYDIQLRLENDALTIMLPGIFPSTYSNNEPVKIPYWAIESFTSPAVFLTQFFEVDRDLSQEIFGWGLKVRMDVGSSPREAISQLTQAILVALRYLLRIQDLEPYVVPLGAFIQRYVINAIAIRQRSLQTYGIDRGQSQQINSPGIYVDSLLGRCSGCEDYIIASRYQDIMAKEQERRGLEINNFLIEKENERRQRRLEDGNLEPFEPAPGGDQ